jgi:H+-transporting ATPase
MVTGDNLATACAVAERVGIGNRAATADVLDRLDAGQALDATFSACHCRQTLVFVMLVATGQGNVYLIRERKHFWGSRPGPWLVASSVADLAIVALMSTRGALMAPVSPFLLFELFASVAIYLIILDQFKVLIFRRFKIH